MGQNSKHEEMTVSAATGVAPTDSLTADAPAGGTGAAAGGWDTAGNRNLGIATINGLNATVASVLTQITAILVDIADIRSKLNA